MCHVHVVALDGATLASPEELPPKIVACDKNCMMKGRPKFHVSNRYVLSIEEGTLAQIRGEPRFDLVQHLHKLVFFILTLVIFNVPLRSIVFS